MEQEDKHITALYFGSFNPLHKGHLAVAEYALDHLPIDEFTFVLSPRNPLKHASVALNSRERLRNLREEVASFAKKYKEKTDSSKLINVSDIEFSLPSPLYTYNTLTAFKAKFPNKKFVIIMGADNIAIIENWYKGHEILSEYEIYVYPRTGYDGKAICKRLGAHFMEGELVNISSTAIRNGVAPNQLEL